MGSILPRTNHSDTDNDTCLPQNYYRAELISIQLGSSRTPFRCRQGFSTPFTPFLNHNCAYQTCRIKGWLILENMTMKFLPENPTSLVKFYHRRSFHSECAPSLNYIVHNGDNYRQIYENLYLNSIDGEPDTSKTVSDNHVLVWPIPTVRTFGFNGCIFTFEAGRRAPYGEANYHFKIKQHKELKKALDRALTRCISTCQTVRTIGTLPPELNASLSVSLPGSTTTTPHIKRPRIPKSPPFTYQTSRSKSPDVYQPMHHPTGSYYYNINHEGRLNHSAGESSSGPQDSDRSRLSSTASDPAPHYYNLNGSITPPDKLIHQFSHEEDEVFINQPNSFKDFEGLRTSPQKSARSSSQDHHRLNYATLDFTDTESKDSSKPKINSLKSPGNICNYVSICDQKTQAIQQIDKSSRESV